MEKILILFLLYALSFNNIECDIEKKHFLKSIEALYYERALQVDNDTIFLGMPDKYKHLLSNGEKINLDGKLIIIEEYKKTRITLLWIFSNLTTWIKMN